MTDIIDGAYWSGVSDDIGDKPRAVYEEAAREVSPHGRYVVLFIPDAGEAYTFVNDWKNSHDKCLLSPSQENLVHVEVVSVFDPPAR